MCVLLWQSVVMVQETIDISQVAVKFRQNLGPPWFFFFLAGPYWLFFLFSVLCFLFCLIVFVQTNLKVVLPNTYAIYCFKPERRLLLVCVCVCAIGSISNVGSISIDNLSVWQQINFG